MVVVVAAVVVMVVMVGEDKERKKTPTDPKCAVAALETSRGECRNWRRGP